ncbi:MAG: RNA-binding protein [Thermodesulfovibrionales bacterium]|nr:RNA-binding protein [Thermodesulfovibrionales bacterium]
MFRKLYVGNLPYNISEETVKQAFMAIGEVASVKLITDETGKNKGFGFVEMKSNEDAKKAIATLNGTNLMGRNVIVSEAKPQKEKGRNPNIAKGKFSNRPYGKGSNQR